MSFAKAGELLELATMASGRYGGIKIQEVSEHFSVSRRTAQRMLYAMHNRFPQTVVDVDDEGFKRWRIPPQHLRDYIMITPEEMAALDIAAKHLAHNGFADDAEHLTSLRHKVVAMVPPSSLARLETDLEALLEAQGLATRPGPKPIFDQEVAGALGHAIKACRRTEIHYRSRSENTSRPRLVEPYGFLTGFRRYLVAREADDPDQRMRLFRLEDVQEARVTLEGFTRDPDFSLNVFTQRAFGVFQNDAEYGEVIWKFRPDAATHAARFEFHPEQSTERLDDGSLVVRFEAAGYLEMCWHLYMWGDAVEVIAPKQLADLVNNHRRSDFPALP